MMGIFERFTDIISADINDLLDKCEDPAKMAKQSLKDAIDELAEVRDKTASVMAEEKRCKRLLDEANAEVQKYDALTRKALTAGNEDDARVLLAKKQQVAANAATAQTTYAVAKDNADKLRAMNAKLTSDIALLKQRLANVEATTSVAKAQETVNKLSSKTGSTALGKFDRAEEKAQARLEKAAAMAELSATPTDEAAEVAAKYGDGASPSIDEELARMKEELGL